MSICAVLGLNRLAPLSAFATDWFCEGWLDSFHGAVGAYWTESMLSTMGLESAELEEVELEVDEELDAFSAAFGSVPVPPKKDWYQPRSTLELMAPATRNHLQQGPETP